MFTFLFRKRTMLSGIIERKTLARPPTEHFCSGKKTVVRTGRTLYLFISGITYSDFTLCHLYFLLYLNVYQYFNFLNDRYALFILHSQALQTECQCFSPYMKFFLL